VAAGLMTLALAIAFSPRALRHVAFFRVRQVELTGVRFHSPERLLDELAIAPDRNLFESLRDIEARAAELPGVISAKAKRRMPGTLTIEVQERVPIAFAPTSTGLLAVDAEAHPLMYDPTATGLDLPILQRADSTLTRVLATVLTADSALFQQVDAARLGDGGVVILELGPRDVILRNEPTTDEIRAVGLVRRHLAATGRPYDELDVRFEGRVIVRGSGV
jgi:cell division septal protein FtsQ